MFDVSDYFRWLFSYFDAFYVVSGLEGVRQLAFSSNLFFFGLLYVVMRYQIPDLVLWLVKLVKPHAYETPPAKIYAGHEPLVSFLIAGRNPGDGVVKSIVSVLQSDYRNVEIIFADDYSTDDSVALARQFERSGKVRVFANAAHSGKPVNLNIALMMARGEYLFVLDADTQIFPDTVHKMLPYFEDPRVGAVCASIFVRNVKESLLTRFQQIEYMMVYTLVQIWRAKLGLIAIVPGMGAMFRTRAVRGLGGYDTGLGEDTDMTLRLRKAYWKIEMALQGRISTDVPVTFRHLMRQRARWSRNMVKIRLKKHWDMGTFRYGFANGIVFWENFLNRMLFPVAAVVLAFYGRFIEGSQTAEVVAGLYWLTTFMIFVKCLIALDFTGVPPLHRLWMVPFYVLYRLPIFLVNVTMVVREVLHLYPWHPYVPKRIWAQIPHR